MKVDDYLDPEVAVPLVRAYFKGVERDGDAPFEFTGAKFDSFARGGNRAETADRITADDIVAANLLGVDLPARASLRLLGPDARRVTTLLRQLPRAQRLADADINALYEPEHPATALWDLLRNDADLGPTKASTLLARKRPHLIPVFDPTIRSALGPIKGHWRRVHDIVTEHGTTLGAIRRDAGVAANVSLLRVLDVAVWMRATGADQVERATGANLLAPAKPKKKAKAKKAKKATKG